MLFQILPELLRHIVLADKLVKAHVVDINDEKEEQRIRHMPDKKYGDKYEV